MLYLLGQKAKKANNFGLALSFENCLLTHSSFYHLKIPKTLFKNCLLREVNFIQTNLTSSLFDGSDLSGAIFSESILEKVDFRHAENYAIDPENNTIKKARFSIYGALALLDKYEIEIEK